MTHAADHSDLTVPARIAGRPRLIALLCVAVLAGLGWLYLGLMMAGMLQTGPAAALGPGMGVLELLGLDRRDGLGAALVEALCRPAFGRGAWDPAQAGLVLAMWTAM